MVHVIAVGTSMMNTVATSMMNDCDSSLVVMGYSFLVASWVGESQQPKVLQAATSPLFLRRMAKGMAAAMAGCNWVFLKP